jgi:hypothetical protein
MEFTKPWLERYFVRQISQQVRDDDDDDDDDDD